MRILFILLLPILFISGSCQKESNQEQYDVVIYGGTSAGVAAAIQAINRRPILLTKN